jgi:hypothetical protein
LRPDSTLPLPCELAIDNSREDLLRRLEQGLAAVSSCFRSFLERHWRDAIDDKPEHDLRLRTVAGIGSLTSPPHDLPADFPSWGSALETAGRMLQDYRSTPARSQLGMPPLPDYFEVKRLLTDGKTPRTVDRAAFGLPLPFYFRSLNGRRATISLKGDKSDRLASPLMIRVYQLASGSCAVVLPNLAQEPGTSIFLGKEIVERRQKEPIAAPDGRIIEQFIAWARKEVARSPQTRFGR